MREECRNCKHVTCEKSILYEDFRTHYIDEVRNTYICNWGGEVKRYNDCCENFEPKDRA